MQIEMWDIQNVVPYPRNPRIISEEAINQVVESIKEVGFRQPIVVNNDGIIIVGHTRLEAAKILKMSTVPVHVASLPKDLEDRYRLRDNKSGEFSKWDVEALSVDWEAPELEELGFDMKDLNINENALDLGENQESGSDCKVCPECGFKL